MQKQTIARKGRQGDAPQARVNFEQFHRTAAIELGPLRREGAAPLRLARRFKITGAQNTCADAS